MSEELITLRTENGKIYSEPKDAKTGAPRYTQESRTGPIHYKESYKDTDPWLDLDATYSKSIEIKGIGKASVYPKLPNIVSVFQDRCGYQIQSRSNPDHIARVELVDIDGLPVTTWQDTAALKTYVRVHPHRVGIWKDFSEAKTAKATTMRWKITELGNSEKDSHPFLFRDTPEAFSTVDLTRLDPDATERARVTIQTARTRIDDHSWYWDELIPVEAKLVDTDWEVGAGGDDGYWYSTTFNSIATTFPLGYSSYIRSYFLRFANITIAQSSTINSSYVSFYQTASSGDDIYLNVYCNDSDNATAPTSVAEANALVLTSAYAPFDYTAGHSSYTWFHDGDISKVIKEVVDRAGWTSGNAIMLLLYDDGTRYNDYRTVATRNYSSGAAPPTLTVTWTEPVTGGHPASKRMAGVPFAATRKGVW